MKELRWSSEKSAWLKKERGLSFDELVSGRFLGIERNRSYKHQWLMLFEVGGYVWVLPYVDSEDYYFLKTAFPSRKHTRIYLKEKYDAPH
jgi:hypothetical protein